MANKRILFVDDDFDWRLIVSDFLAEAGFHVVTAKDAAETMLAAARLELDLVGGLGMFTERLRHAISVWAAQWSHKPDSSVMAVSDELGTMIEMLADHLGVDRVVL